ncbi:MAG: substrate-binding domain-containing protein [Burkholderiales bacterium]
MLDPAEIRVMLSAAFKEAYLELVPEFERTSGNKVTSLWVPSVKIMIRLQGGETVDLVILSAASLDELITLGIIANDARYDLARSGIGAAVRAAGGRSRRARRSRNRFPVNQRAASGPRGSIWSGFYRLTFRR